MRNNTVVNSIFRIAILVVNFFWYFCVVPQDPDTLQPNNLSYDSTEYTFYIDESFPEISPAYEEGEPDSFVINPPLPKGLFFNKETGVISGMAKDTISTTTFTISAGNRNGTDSITITITVLAPPEFIVQPEDVAVFKGESALFSAVAAGAEPLTYRWTKDTSEIEGADSTRLDIDDVQKEDTGYYCCFVTDVNGREAKSNIVRCIISTDTTPPVIIISPSTQSAVTGENVAFTVTVNGVSLSYQWWKNGKEIEGAALNYYQIDSFTVNDTGIYRVIVTNKYGSDTSQNAHLIIGETSAIIHEINLSIEGNGRVKYQNRFYATDTTLTLARGATATMHFLPDSGYFLRDISVNDTTDSTLIVNGFLLIEEIFEDCSIAVAFDTVQSDFLVPDSFSLKITVNDTTAGSVIIEPLQDRYEKGDTVTLTAVPWIGNVFTGWSDSSRDTINPIKVIIVKDDTLQAIFGPDPEIEEWSVLPGVSLNALIAQLSGSPIPGAIIKPEPGEYDENTVIIEGDVDVEIYRRAP